MERRLMIEVDEQLLALLAAWQGAGQAKREELMLPDYDHDRSAAAYRAEREAILRLALGVERRIQEAMEQVEGGRCAR